MLNKFESDFPTLEIPKTNCHENLDADIDIKEEWDRPVQNEIKEESWRHTWLIFFPIMLGLTIPRLLALALINPHLRLPTARPSVNGASKITPAK